MAKKRRSKTKQPTTPAPEQAVDEVRSPFVLPPWLGWAGLVVVVLLEAYLVMAAANPSPHSGGDNAGYLSLAFSLLDGGQYLELWEPGDPAHTKYPPGYALVLAALMSLGARTWTALKASSAFFMVAAVGLAYLWVWRRSSWGLALAVAVVLAFSDSFIYSSQWVLSDPMFLVLTLAALVALDRGTDRSDSRTGPSENEGVESTADGQRSGQAWLVAGVLAAVAAYFTRSAGLPLLVAVGAWLAWKRDWKALGFTAAVFVVPAVLWSVRAQVAGAPGYVSEFWMINPYDPALGRAGLGELIQRIIQNAGLYLGSAIPAGITGRRGPATMTFGVLLALCATVGWARRLRTPHVAELFAPLYLGLILLWPTVWSGDRFALPLFAIVLFYAGEALRDFSAKLHANAPALVGALAVFLLVLPAGQQWSVYVSQAELCRERVTAEGAYGCYQPRMREFVSAARWATTGLPEGSVVLTRKPRTFFLLSEVKSRTYPLMESADTLLSFADDAGARYTLIDYLDNLGSRYLVPSVHQQPRAFCALVGFGGGEEGVQTQLLGVRAPQDRPTGPGATAQPEPGSLSIPYCPETYMTPEAAGSAPFTSLEVPLLSRLDE